MVTETNLNKTHADLSARLWPRLIDLWIAGVLVTFFVVRILGSETGHHIFSLFHKVFR